MYFLFCLQKFNKCIYFLGKQVSAPVNIGSVPVKPVSIPAATFYNTRIFGKASVCSISKDNDIQRPKVSLFDNNNAAGENSGQSSISRF